MSYGSPRYGTPAGLFSYYQPKEPTLDDAGDPFWCEVVRQRVDMH